MNCELWTSGTQTVIKLAMKGPQRAVPPEGRPECHPPWSPKASPLPLPPSSCPAPSWGPLSDLRWLLALFTKESLLRNGASPLLPLISAESRLQPRRTNWVGVSGLGVSLPKKSLWMLRPLSSQLPTPPPPDPLPLPSRPIPFRPNLASQPTHPPPKAHSR